MNAEVNGATTRKRKKLLSAGGCDGTFKCAGDIVKCSSNECPVLEDDDRRRRLQASGTQPFYGRKLSRSYRSCAGQCGVTIHDDDDRRRRRFTYADLEAKTPCVKTNVAYHIMTMMAGMISMRKHKNASTDARIAWTGVLGV